MASYMHGNLAVKQNKQQTKRVLVKETTRTVYRRSKMAMHEKLLFLSALGLIGVILGSVVWGYAGIYTINHKITVTQSKIHKMSIDNSMLKQQIDKLNDPVHLREEAINRGYKPLQEKQVVHIPAKTQVGAKETVKESNGQQTALKQ